jgi:hypothetical protein
MVLSEDRLLAAPIHGHPLLGGIEFQFEPDGLDFEFLRNP